MDEARMLREARRQAGLTQAELAQRAKTSQATIAAYETGRKSARVPTLERIATALDAVLDVRITPAGEDIERPRPVAELSREERRSLWLHWAIASHIQLDPPRAMALARHNMAATRRAVTRRRTFYWHAQWSDLLEGPLEEILALLTSTSTRASVLRQTAPFAGLLPARQRWAVYRAFRECDDARAA